MSGFEAPWLMDGYLLLSLRGCNLFFEPKWTELFIFRRTLLEENKELRGKGIKAVTEFCKRRRQGSMCLLLVFQASSLDHLPCPALFIPEYLWSGSVSDSFQSVHWMQDDSACTFLTLRNAVLLVCVVARCQQQRRLPTALLNPNQQLRHRPALCRGFTDHPALTQVSVRSSVSVLLSRAWERCIDAHLEWHWSFDEMCTKWSCAKPGDVEGELNVAAEVWCYVHVHGFDIHLWFTKLSRVPVQHSLHKLDGFDLRWRSGKNICQLRHQWKYFYIGLSK